MKSFNLRSKKVLITLSAVLAIGGVGTVAVLLIPNSSKPVYSFAVRENIENNQSEVGWNLYCHHQYKNGHVKKEFIGQFRTIGISQVGDRIETSQCSR